MIKIENLERIPKAARESQRVIYKGIPIRLPIDCSSETSQVRREWHDTLKVLKRKKKRKRREKRKRKRLGLRVEFQKINEECFVS